MSTELNFNRIRQSSFVCSLMQLESENISESVKNKDDGESHFREYEFKSVEERTREDARYHESPYAEVRSCMAEVSFNRFPLYVLSPDADGHEVIYGYIDLFRESQWATLIIGYVERGEGIDTLIRRFNASLPGADSFCEGEISYPANGNVRIKPGIRRVREVPEEKVAEGVTYHQFTTDRWRGKYATATFYSWCVSPIVRELEAKDPFQWAKSRMEIVAGYSNIVGKDFNVYFAEHSYSKIAELAANTCPKSLLYARHYTLTDHRRTLLEEATAQTGKAPIAELAIFLMQLSHRLELDNIKSPSFRTLAESLTQALSNGLVIDRLSQLFRFHLTHGAGSQEALNHVAAIVANVYTQGAKPWWFHENADLRPKNRNAFISNAETRALEVEIAATHGFSFVFGREIFQLKGQELLNFEGISRASVLDFCAYVTKSFGIGNTSRACNVLDFAIALMREQPVSARERALALLLPTLEEQKPQSELIGALEGSEVNFDKPGLFTLLASHVKEAQLEAEKVDELSVSPKLITQMAEEGLSRPLAERARLEIAALSSPRQIPLLSYNVAGLLPAPDSELPVLSKSAREPLLSWLEFQRQLVEEVPHDRVQVSQFYLGGCANKLHDPLHPPKGFLNLLYKLNDLPVPGYRFTALEHPDDRRNVAHENAELRRDRWFFLYNLLDTQALGIISWAHLEDTLKWILAPIDPAEKRKIETDASWHKHEEPNEALQWQCREAEYEAIELCKSVNPNIKSVAEFVARTQRTDAWREFCGSEMAPWVRRSIQETTQKLQKLHKQDLPVFDPETQSAEQLRRNEEYFVRDVEDKVRKLWQSRCNKKIEDLTNGMAYLLALKEFVVVGVLPATSIEVAWPEILMKAREGETPDLKAAQEFVAQIEKNSRAIEHMHSLGYFNRETLQGFFKDESVLRAPLSFVAKICSAVEVFDKARSEIERLVNRTIRGTGFEDFKLHSATLIQKIEESAVSLEPFREFYSESAMQLIRGEFSWWKRYVDVLGKIEAVKREVIDPRYPLPTARYENSSASNVLMVNNFFVSSLLACRTLDRYDEQNSTPKRTANEKSKPQLWIETTSSPGDEEGQKEPEFPLVVRNLELETNTDSPTAEELRSIDVSIVLSRVKDIGKLPIGGKIHVLHAIDECRFEVFLQKFGFTNTSFQLQHASRSLIIPPVPSFWEFRYLINLLAREGIVDSAKPEIQVCGLGRLSPELCAYSGAAILLSTKAGVRFNRNSFATTHNDDTGFRIMAYDKGGTSLQFPFCDGLSGRTDMFGRRHLDDVANYQTLHSVLVDGMFGNRPFSHLSESLMERIFGVLRKHGLESVLTASWIHEDFRQRSPEKSGAEHFSKALKPCEKAWMESYRRSHKEGQLVGILADMREVLDWLNKEVKNTQELLLVDPKYEQERQLLFTLAGTSYV